MTHGIDSALCRDRTPKEQHKRLARFSAVLMTPNETLWQHNSRTRGARTVVSGSGDLVFFQA